jgi:PAS domain S-box-containing protein
MSKYSNEDIIERYKSHDKRELDRLLVGIVELDHESKIVGCNKTFLETLSFPPSVLQKSSWMNFIFPEDLADAINYFENVTSGQSVDTNLKIRFQKSNNEIVWMNILLVPTEKSLTPNFIFVAENITEGASLEQNLKVTTSRSRFLFESMAEGVVFLSHKGAIEIFNKRAGEIFDLPSNVEHVDSEWVPKGKFCDESYQNIDKKQLPIHIARRNGESFYDYVVQFTKENGKACWLSINVIPMFDYVGEDGTGAVVTFNDITKRKESEFLMINSAKLATLGEMSASIAHEIKNPLAIIFAKIGNLLKKIDPKTGMVSVKGDELEMIKATANRINKIVSGLKSFSRTGENDPYELGLLKDIVADSINLYSEKFKSESVDFRVQIPDDLSFRCRFVQISQVIINLVGNAFDAIREFDEKWIEVKAHSIDKDKFVITVTDCGKGILPEIAEKLMNPFFTTKARGQGTGLGLSISKKIIESHNGKFFLDQASPNTRFVIELPYNPAASDSANNSGSQAA